MEINERIDYKHQLNCFMNTKNIKIDKLYEKCVEYSVKIDYGRILGIFWYELLENIEFLMNKWIISK